MRIVIALGIASIVVAGCGLAQSPEGDAGPNVGDAYVPPACTGNEMPPFYCAFVDGNHVCGDAEVGATCVDGAWQCPPGTSRDSECWCSGFTMPQPWGCVCMPGGWSCPEPIDAGPPTVACTSDPRLTLGQPCANEGMHCGECPGPCGTPCDATICLSGTWQEVELPFCPTTTFPCGMDPCQRFSEYCDHIVSDIGGEPDTYRCQPFPEDCPADCACFGTNAGQSCTNDGNGAVTLTLGGG